jgi:hypothetical protein
MEYKMAQFLVFLFYQKFVRNVAAIWLLVFLRYFFDGIQVANGFI